MKLKGRDTTYKTNFIEDIQKYKNIQDLLRKNV